ncbi:MAG TPA: response regulator [Planctomycetota bacterium]|nr:response regulator [Planctomycetota bacterium]
MSQSLPSIPPPKQIRDVKRERILVIEDEPDILEVVRYNLTNEGYRVTSSTDGVEGLRLATREAPDLIILDLMLPGLDGIEICRRLRQDPVTRSIPIIMATAKSEESDLVLGLGVGADDYIVKPFRPRELLARCQAVLRRGTIRDEGTRGDRIVVDRLVIDSVRHEVLVEDMPTDFTATEFRLLHFLASHPGRVFDRAHLISRTIGDHAIVLDRNIDVHVRSLRRKLGKYRDYIETVRGVGYRFRDSRRQDS